jgi:hypothetical protein
MPSVTFPATAEPGNSDLDSAERALLDRLEEQIDVIIEQIVESVAGTAGFEPIRDGAGLKRLMHPQRFLDHVFGLGHAAEYPVGDRERGRPQLAKQSLAIGHDAASVMCAQFGGFEPVVME